MVTKRWKCEVCGYIHDANQPPDTCPICGVGAEMFSRYQSSKEESIKQPASAWRCTICNEVIEGSAPPDRCPVCGAEASLFVPHELTPSEGDISATGDHIIIVGGGVAGQTAADFARRNDSTANIKLVHKEEELPYNRLNLTRLLAGEVNQHELPLKTVDWYEKQKIQTIAGDVVRIHRKEKQIELRNQGSLSYDRLILTNGSHPFIPPIVGANRSGVFSLRTIKDAQNILNIIKPEVKCVCIGGGLLGLETAAAIAKRGAKVTVLEGFDYLLPRQLAQPAANLLETHLEGVGIKVICQAKVESIPGDEDVRGVQLKDTAELPADLVVFATGVRPNSYLARQSGLEVKHGLLVNDYMQTTDENIYGAGDVAEHDGKVYGLWPTALGQAAVAGVNAVKGNSVKFASIPPSSQLKVLDISMFSIGQFQPTDASFQVYEHQMNSVYSRLVVRDAKVVGANLFGDTTAAGAIKAAIEQNLQLTECGELFEKYEVLSSFIKLHKEK